MSKFLFVSDIHLNLRSNYTWELQRFTKLKDFLLTKEADTIILGGDIFDLPNPSLEEISLFYQFVSDLSKNKDIIVISGNHEDIDKNTCIYDKIPQVNYKYYDATLEPIKIGKYNLYFVSHHKLNDIKKIEPLKGFNILFSHLRCDYRMIKGEFSTKILSKKFDYIILGDIHEHYYPEQNVAYCGSPYSIKFTESKVTGIFEITLGKTFELNFLKTDFLPQKIKLVLDVDEVKDIITSIKNTNNLYKVYVKGNEEDFIKLDDYKNIKFIFMGNLNNTNIKEASNKVKNNYFNVLEELYHIIDNLDITEEEKESSKTILDIYSKGV